VRQFFLSKCCSTRDEKINYRYNNKNEIMKNRHNKLLEASDNETFMYFLRTGEKVRNVKIYVNQYHARNLDKVKMHLDLVYFEQYRISCSSCVTTLFRVAYRSVSQNISVTYGHNLHTDSKLHSYYSIIA